MANGVCVCGKSVVSLCVCVHLKENSASAHREQRMAVEKKTYERGIKNQI